MFYRALSAAVCLGLAGAAAAAAGDKAGGAAEVQKYLDKLKSPEAKVEAVKSKDVEKAFPGVAFVTVHYRMWPVAIAPPESLKSQNLFAVDKDTKLHHFTDAKGLEKFAQTHLTVRPKGTSAEAAVRAWLTLSQAFVQDGFYKFRLAGGGSGGISSDGSVTDIERTLEVVPEGGNKGTLGARLYFSKDGKLTRVEEFNKVVRGMRPRCQATRLLDPDPVIRAICEDSLLVLGRLAEGYLNEQRAAASPELRRAIDRVWKRIVEEGR